MAVSDSEMNRMQQDAIRRVREMQARAMQYQSGGQPESRRSDTHAQQRQTAPKGSMRRKTQPRTRTVPSTRSSPHTLPRGHPPPAGKPRPPTSGRRSRPRHSRRFPPRQQPCGPPIP